MLELVETSSINVRQNHQDAWANFYSDVWRQEFGTRFGVMPTFLLEALANNLRPYGAKIKQDPTSNNYILCFEQERDYTWFELKWASHYDPNFPGV